MGASMKALSVAQIESRLRELSRAESQFRARDFDAELKDVLKAGGDVDAIEAAQIEQERQARRIRAERAALGELLPEATLREGEARQKAIETEWSGLAIAAEPVVQELVETLARASELGRQFMDINTGAGSLLRDAIEIQKRSGAPVPAIGALTSVSASKALTQFRELDMPLGYACGAGFTIGGYCYSKELG